MQLQHDRKISPAWGEFVLRLLHASGIYCLTKTHLMWSSQSALQLQHAKWGNRRAKHGSLKHKHFPALQILSELPELQEWLWESQRGCPEREAHARDGFHSAEFMLLFLRQKCIVCSVLLLAALEGEGPLVALELSAGFQDP